MQYKLIHSFYFTPSKLHSMSVTSNDLCWTCNLDMQTLAHATWKYKQVWSSEAQIWINLIIPLLPKLCVLVG